MKSIILKLVKIILVISLIILLTYSLFEFLEHRDRQKLFEGKSENIVYSRLGDIYEYDMRHKYLKTIFEAHRTGRYATYPIWSNGNSILFTVQDAAFAARYIGLIGNKGDNFTPVLRINEHAEMPDISLDKKKIAFLCGKWVEQLGRIDYKLCIANVDGTGIKKISDINLYPYKPSWSPDGKKIAFTGFENIDKMKDQEKIKREGMAAMGLNIYIFDIETGITNKIINSGVGPAWSPEGKYIAYFEPIPNSDKADLKLFNISSEEQRTLIKNKIFDGSPLWSSDGKFIFYQRYGLIFFPPEKSIIELYSVEQNKSVQILEVRNKIFGFSVTR